jgi:hypothetical protein
MNYVSIILILFTLLSVFMIFAAVSPSQVTVNQLLEAHYITTTMEILGIGTFVVSILAPMILTKLHFKSLRKGFMVFMLNFGLSFVRTRAAIAAYLTHSSPVKRMAEGREEISCRNGNYNTIRNSFSEISFSSILMVLGVFAFIGKQHIRSCMAALVRATIRINIYLIL